MCQCNACADRNAYVCAPTVINGQETTACVYKDYAWDYMCTATTGRYWLMNAMDASVPMGPTAIMPPRHFHLLVVITACMTQITMPVLRPNAEGNNNDPNGMKISRVMVRRKQPSMRQGLARQWCSFQGRQGMDKRHVRTPQSEYAHLCAVNPTGLKAHRLPALDLQQVDPALTEK